jgi:uncharacterized membrane protein YccF (DUF307 family)
VRTVTGLTLAANRAACSLGNGLVLAMDGSLGCECFSPGVGPAVHGSLALGMLLPRKASTTTAERADSARHSGGRAVESGATMSYPPSAAAPPHIVVDSGGPNLLIRLIYFVLIGWWLGGIMSAVAWLLCITIIGLPLGLWLINRLPSVITLRPQEAWRMEDGVLRRGADQHPFLLRALWFVLIGWWLSAIWMVAAYAALLTIILIPISFWMYGRIGAVTTLYRS